MGLESGELVLHLILLFLLTSFEFHLESFSSLLDSLKLDVFLLTDSGVVSLDLDQLGIHLLSSDGLRLLKLLFDLLNGVGLSVLAPRHLQFLSDLWNLGSGRGSLLNFDGQLETLLRLRIVS